MTSTPTPNSLNADTSNPTVVSQYHTESDSSTVDSLTSTTTEVPASVLPISATESPLRRVNPYGNSTSDAIAGRRTRIITSTWTNTSAIGTGLFQFPFADFWTQNSSILAASQNFAAVRWKSITLEIEMSAVSTLRGSMKLYVFPVAPNFAYGNNFNNYMQAEGFRIDATSTPNAAIEIPWRYPVDAISIANLRSLNGAYGLMGCVVEAPLTSDLPPGAACSISYSLYATFNDLEFLLPCPSQNYTAPTLTPSTSAYTIPTTNLAAQSSREAKSKSTSTVSGVLEAASSVAAAVASIPVAGAIAQPLATGMALAGSFARSMGFSKPENISATLYNQNYSARDTAATHGLTDALIIHGDPAEKIASDAKIFNVLQDEMDLLAQAAMPSPLYYTTAGLTSTNPVFTMAVYPSTIQKVANSTINVTFAYNHDTRLSRACRFASHWCGSLIYTCRIFASSVIRGKFMWIWSPTSTYDYNTCRKYEFDLNGSTTIDFEVPWAALTDWLPIAFEQSSTNHFMSNGFVSLVPLTPPAASGNANAAAVNITIEVRAGPGFKLQGSRPYTGLGYQHLAGNETSGGFTASFQSHAGQEVSKLNYDENDHHLRVLAHRVFGANTSLVPMTPLVISLNGLPKNTDLEFLMAGYAYYRGSFIFRAFPYYNAALAGATPVYAIYSDTNSSVNFLQDPNFIPNGAMPFAIQDLYFSSSCAFKFHWQSNVRGFQTTNAGQPIPEITHASVPAMTLSMRAGPSVLGFGISACDDFLLSGLLPSPVLASKIGSF